MRVRSKPRNALLEAFRGNHRQSAVAIVQVLAYVCALSLAVAYAFSQAPNPGAPLTDISNIPKPLADTFDQINIRNGANAPPLVPRKKFENGDACLLPPLSLIHPPMVATTSLQVPNKARTEYEEACADLTNKKTENLEKHLRKAVQEYPQYSAAWVTLGQVLAMQHENEEARKACSHGAMAESSYVPAYLCLADIAAKEKAWDDVLKLSSRALEVDPATNPISYEYNAAANLRVNKLADAEKSALRGLEIDKNNAEPRVHFVLAQIYEAKGDRGNEMAQLREYLKFATDPEDAAIVKQYLSQLEKQTGK